MPQQLTNMFGVSRPNLEQIAVVAGHMMQLEHLGTLASALATPLSPGASSLRTATNASIA